MSINIVKNLNSVQTLTTRIISGEGLNVVFDIKARTASFDIKTRTLTFPVMDNMENDIFVYFMMHEIGHCLFTKSRLFDKIKKAKIRHIVFNIVEDVRIEKMIMEKYRGVGKYFKNGSRKLYESGFFGDVDEMKTYTQCIDGDDKNNKKTFLDRINIHFKLGIRGVYTIKFTKKESDIIETIKNAKKESDIIGACKMVHEYLEIKDEESGEKEKEKESGKKEKKESGKKEKEESDEKEKEESDEKDESGKKDKDESDEKDKEESGEKEENESGEKEENESDEKDKEESGKKDKEEESDEKEEESGEKEEESGEEEEESGGESGEKEEEEESDEEESGGESGEKEENESGEESGEKEENESGEESGEKEEEESDEDGNYQVKTFDDLLEKFSKNKNNNKNNNDDKKDINEIYAIDLKSKTYKNLIQNIF